MGGREEEEEEEKGLVSPDQMGAIPHTTRHTAPLPFAGGGCLPLHLSPWLTGALFCLGERFLSLDAKGRLACGRSYARRARESVADQPAGRHLSIPAWAPHAMASDQDLFSAMVEGKVNERLVGILARTMLGCDCIPNQEKRALLVPTRL